MAQSGAQQPLRRGVFLLTRTARGIELYFPPLRAPAHTLSLALFGAAALVAGSLAALTIAPLALFGAGGAIALWLMSIFIVPLVLFGLSFLGLAAYQAVNSLTVEVTESEIRSLRRVLGVALRERRIAVSEAVSIEPAPDRHFRWPRDDLPCYRLLLVSRGATTASAVRGRGVVVADSLAGDELMEQVRAEIGNAARLGRTTNEADSRRPGATSPVRD